MPGRQRSRFQATPDRRSGQRCWGAVQVCPGYPTPPIIPTPSQGSLVTARVTGHRGGPTYHRLQSSWIVALGRYHWPLWPGTDKLGGGTQRSSSRGRGQGAPWRTACGVPSLPATPSQGPGQERCQRAPPRHTSSTVPGGRTWPRAAWWAGRSASGLSQVRRQAPGT